MDEDEFEYIVLINDEEQHSLWPSFKEIPLGWKQVGPTGTKAECLEYVEEAWPDITPLSVRKRMAEYKAQAEAKAKAEAEAHAGDVVDVETEAEVVVETETEEKDDAKATKH
ncbi:MbtH family protein [Flexibacterium corallicola]|uniref:MbtH family protein n=1 Tax=Flexibacterium corallicola TaxID=3037259 RepID=UPI00286F2D2F|nr:MbtH family protein [Pseudovibrio sp. M1P-2-3]